MGGPERKSRTKKVKEPGNEDKKGHTSKKDSRQRHQPYVTEGLSQRPSSATTAPTSDEHPPPNISAPPRKPKRSYGLAVDDVLDIRDDESRALQASVLDHGQHSRPSYGQTFPQNPRPLELPPILPIGERVDSSLLPVPSIQAQPHINGPYPPTRSHVPPSGHVSGARAPASSHMPVHGSMSAPPRRERSQASSYGASSLASLPVSSYGPQRGQHLQASAIPSITLTRDSTEVGHEQAKGLEPLRARDKEFEPGPVSSFDEDGLLLPESLASEKYACICQQNGQQNKRAPCIDHAAENVERNIAEHTAFYDAEYNAWDAEFKAVSTRLRARDVSVIERVKLEKKVKDAHRMRKKAMVTKAKKIEEENKWWADLYGPDGSERVSDPSVTMRLMG